MFALKVRGCLKILDKVETIQQLEELKLEEFAVFRFFLQHADDDKYEVGESTVSKGHQTTEDIAMTDDEREEEEKPDEDDRSFIDDSDADTPENAAALQEAATVGYNCRVPERAP